MAWNEDALYGQFLQRDPTFNGRFVTGVLTTGIYCLPSCPARRPKRENTRFFRTPAEALQFGLRPCRRCRPDDFYRGEEWHENLYEQTADRVWSNVAAFRDIADLTRASGLSRTALTALFRDHGHEAPAAFLRRARADHVQSLLRQRLKPADAAAAAGYESSSSFHEQFVSRTGLTPGAYAALGTSFSLKLPAGYRAVTPALRHCLLIGGRAALIDVAVAGTSAVCHTDAVDVYAAHAAITRMLGFDSDASAFERQFGADAFLGPVVGRQRGLAIPLTVTPWEALAWAIMGQQISLQAAASLRRELTGALGREHASGLRTHPSPEEVAAAGVDRLRTLKFSGSKAEYLVAAAASSVPLDGLRRLSARHAARRLGAVRGIGPWTVQYTFLRGLGFADCIPAGDAGLARALEHLTGSRPSEPAIRQMLERFAPWRSLTTYHLWASLTSKAALKGDLNNDD